MRNIKRKTTQVNRTVDGDEAEGHARATMEEAELKTARKVTKRAPALDDEAEGHAVLKSR